MKKLLQMRVLWLLLTMCSLACNNSHAQSLNERLIKAIDKGKYDEAKKLILRRASPFYVDKTFVAGTAPVQVSSFREELNSNMKVKSKTAGKAVVEAVTKTLLLPFIILGSFISSRRKVGGSKGYYLYNTIFDDVLDKPDSPEKTKFVVWLFRRGVRRMYTQKQDDLFRCAILSQDLFFISQLLKQGYNTRVSINQEPCIYYVMAKYPVKTRNRVIDWLLVAEENSPTSSILFRDVLKQAVRNNETELIPMLVKRAQSDINNDPIYFSEILTLTSDIKILETLVASGIKIYKTAILHQVIDANAPKKDIYAVLKFFLDKGVKVNASAGNIYNDEATPLSFFIHKYQKKHTLAMYQTVQLLLDYGANPLIQYKSAIPDALTQAIIRQDDQLFRLLLKHLTPKQIKADSVSHVVTACKYFKPQYIQALITKRFEWKGKNDMLGYLLDINSPEKLAFLTYFLEQGAKPNVISKKEKIK